MREDYKEFFTRKSDGSTNYYIKSEQVERGEERVIQWISGEDETTAFTSLRFGIEKLGVMNWFAEEKSPGAGELYWTENPVHLMEGERLVMRFNGTTNNDILKGSILGYTKRIPKP